MKTISCIAIMCLLALAISLGLCVAPVIPSNSQSISSPPGASLTSSLSDESAWEKHVSFRLGLIDTNELFWDDGQPEAYFLVRSPPLGNDRFAVRFDLPSPPPLKIVGGRFYTSNSVLRMQSFSACRDAGGYPDIFKPIDKVDSVAGGNPGWGYYPLHGVVFDTSDIWAVVHWYATFMVGIGADSTSPDGNSYWCSHVNGTTWHQWTATDWMLRLSVASTIDSHDVAATVLLDPPDRFLPGDTSHPTAVFGNCGLSAETFNVNFEIKDSVGTTVYTSSRSISLASGRVDTVVFTPMWIGRNEGRYYCKAFTALSGDADPANDTVRMPTLCSREIIITYSGNETSMGEAIIGSWATNRKFLVRMTPPIPPPFYLRRAEVLLCDANMPLEYVCVSPDNGSGLPDTAVVLARATNISTPLARTWASASLGEISVSQSGDLWMIAKWPEGITEPHIGLDLSDPSTQRSWRYYFKDGIGHYENMGVPPYYREWFFRLVIAVPPVGVAEETQKQPAGFGLHCKPRPSAGPVFIDYAIPRAGKIIVTIYDASGRMMKSFSGSNAQPVGQLRWDGLDEDGRRVSPGIYFVRLETAGQKLIDKVVLVK